MMKILLKKVVLQLSEASFLICVEIVPREERDYVEKTQNKNVNLVVAFIHKRL